MNIPLVDIAAQQAEIADEAGSAVAEVLASGQFIGGPVVAEFERAYAAAVGVRHCVGVANGTDALELALRAVGIGPGDEAIIPANTFIATAEAVARIGATPVLVDVDEEHLLIDPVAVGDAITGRTRAIIPVHLFGQVAPVELIDPLARGAGAIVIEDAAQSQGARRNGRAAGSLGAAAATSFYPGKNLGAAGDAGAVTTDDDDVARRIRRLGSHGSETRYVHDVIGVNSRLDALQAAVLSVKLRRLEKWNARRRELAERYAEQLAESADVRLPGSAIGNDDVWHLYVVRIPERDRVVAAMNADGIGSAIHYPTPVHRTAAFADLGYAAGAFPVAEAAAGQILSLPIHPHLTNEQQDRVVDSLRRAMS